MANERQDRTFSATDPPPAEDIEASIEWAREIIRRNQEFEERERRMHDEETRTDPYPYL